MGSPLGFRGIPGRGRVEFALEVPVAEPVDGEVSNAANRLAVSGWIGLKAATRVAVTGWHRASSSAVAAPVSGTRASAVRRRPLAAWATSAERQKLATPLVIGHHRGSWSAVADRSTLNSRGLLMVVSTRNTLAWS